ncbi:MAG: YaiI/YqxD family protein [Hyphomicrobiales bacterium]
MTEIYVDADACPVKDEVMRVAYRHQLKVHFVSNAFMRLDDSPLVNRVVVPDGPDVADDWIAEHITLGDIAITADIPLAARCVEAKAEALSPNGKPFTKDSIGMALAMRNLMTDLRETGEISGHNAAFSKKNRSDFLQALENMVQNAKRSAGT